MPSAIIHRCVNKRVEEELKKYKTIQDKYIYDVAAIAPDSWRNTERFKNSNLPKKQKRMYSHFSKENEFVENYNFFKEKYKNNLDNPFIFGYLIHLMTDNFWRLKMYYKNTFDINNIDNELLNIEHLEEKSEINNDVEILTKKLSEYYKIKELRNILDEEIEQIPSIDELTYDGINDTINFTNKQLTKEINSKTIKYDLNDIVNGIEICVKKIIDELGEL
jgi:hypothetical protein